MNGELILITWWKFYQSRVNFDLSDLNIFSISKVVVGFLLIFV